MYTLPIIPDRNTKYKGCLSLHPYQYEYQISFLLDERHSNCYEVLVHCAFSLHFPGV